MDIVTYRRGADLAAIGPAWDRLSARESQHVPSFFEIEQSLSRGDEILIFAATESGEIKSLACFQYADSVKRYELATRRLFDLPVKKVYLQGSCVLGQPDENFIRLIFASLLEDRRIDIIDTGDIVVDSPLYRAIRSLPGRPAVWRSGRKDQMRWLIDLPDTFDAYLALLSSENRRRITRYARKVDKEEPAYRMTSQPDQVGDFLRDAEIISRFSYQWKLGRGVSNNDWTRSWFAKLAEKGLWRAYVLSLHGQPAAYAWGELCEGKFLYRAIGYDPRFARLSPGTVLFARLIRDLIEDTDCRIFDFGSGGADGYKAHLATTSLRCARFEVGPRRPYPLMLGAIELVLESAKNATAAAAERLLGENLNRRLKSVLRPFGIAVY